MKDADNPMNPAERFRRATRCTAKAKRTGERCKCPAVTDWTVCRVHGARGGAPKGPANGNWKHGGRSREVTETRRIGSELSRQAQRALAAFLRAPLPKRKVAIDEKG